MGDLVIFKKTGKEWNYGKIVGRVDERSYIICDSFGNFYRRNRRFIAKTKNSSFNASDLLFEENIRHNVANPDNFKEIQIVPPQWPVTENRNRGIEPNYCTVEEPVISDGENVMHESSSEDYETAGSTGSETGSDSEHETPTPVVDSPETNLSRFGRAIRPPRRYGWTDR